MQHNVELVRQAYAAIDDGDLPGLTELMAEDVEIELPGPSAIPFAGTYRGHDGVAQFATDLVENIQWDTREFEVRDVIAQGDKVAVLGHEQLTATPTDRSWDTDWAMVWTVRDDEIVRLREFHQTAAIADAYR